MCWRGWATQEHKLPNIKILTLWMRPRGTTSVEEDSRIMEKPQNIKLDIAIFPYNQHICSLQEAMVSSVDVGELGAHGIVDPFGTFPQVEVFVSSNTS